MRIRHLLPLVAVALSGIAFSAEPEYPANRCEALNLLATTAVIVKHSPMRRQSVDVQEFVRMVLASEFAKIPFTEQEATQFVREIVLGGPYKNEEQEAVSAGYFFDFQCRLEKDGRTVPAYSTLTEDLRKCWKSRSDQKVKECFVRAMTQPVKVVPP